MRGCTCDETRSPPKVRPMFQRPKSPPQTIERARGYTREVQGEARPCSARVPKGAERCRGTGTRTSDSGLSRSGIRPPVPLCLAKYTSCFRETKWAIGQGSDRPRTGRGECMCSCGSIHCPGQGDGRRRPGCTTSCLDERGAEGVDGRNKWGPGGRGRMTDYVPRVGCVLTVCGNL